MLIDRSDLNYTYNIHNRDSDPIAECFDFGELLLFTLACELVRAVM